MALSAADARTFERCMAVGGIAVFPADTVYGLACEPDSKEAVQRLYLLKRRSPDKPAAVMFFDLDLALDGAARARAADAARAARAAARAPSRCCCPTRPRRFPLACGAGRRTRSGLRVPRGRRRWPRWRDVRWPVLQSSANVAGAPDARRLQDVPQYMREHTDLVLDGGELPGTPVDGGRPAGLRGSTKTWSVAREGAMSVTESPRG